MKTTLLVLFVACVLIVPSIFARQISLQRPPASTPLTFCEVFDLDRNIESIRPGDRVFRRPGAWMWQYGPGNNWIVPGETIPGGIKATVLHVEQLSEAESSIHFGKVQICYLPDRQRELLQIKDVRTGVDPLCLEPGGDPTSNGWATADLGQFRLLKPGT